MYTGSANFLKSVYSAPKTNYPNNPVRSLFDETLGANADAAEQSMIAAARKNSMALILKV